MSKWYEPKPSDVSMSDDGRELHVWIDSDEEGNIYVSLERETLQKVKKLLS